MNNNQVIVVGGGAAGMTAAISARRLGAEVIILEKNPRVGKKILATGNGRCNFTNINADISCYHGENPKFAYSALSDFTIEDTLNFFEELGITYKVEDFGKVFPMSNQASSILDVLMYELNALGVGIVCDANVKNIKCKNNEFIIELLNNTVYKCDRIILATGGKAMPSTGSDGYGYDLAVNLGHTMTDIFPALVQLMLEGAYFKRIDGVKFVGTAEIIHKGKSVAKDRGDILFTNYGVSGPPILQISRKAGELLNHRQEAYVKINIFDTMTKEEASELLDKRFKNAAQKTVEFSMVGLINKRLIPVVLAEAGIIDLKRQAASLSGKEKEAIAEILTNWRLGIKGTKSWPSAQVTAGGIRTDDINPKTMESKLVKGLFFAGEIMDIDGMCGGFNLQWAWSSGFIAGKNAAL
ncbi:MAG: NAD(P)/FAD-dependent oxidoreductase [Acetivibrionales bacterium]|jgi:predicted Rossmann fold flavoprotein|nr:NAD(P)/FAD-dependent oxidoreductase [Clostridiaceae bacterium]